jgi:hypothetical protein
MGIGPSQGLYLHRSQATEKIQTVNALDQVAIANNWLVYKSKFLTAAE